MCDDVFGPVSVHDVLKQPLSCPLAEAAQPGFANHMFVEAPGPIRGHNGVYFQKEGTLKRPSLSSSPIPSPSFLSFQLYLSVSPSLSLPLFYHFVSSNNASSQFTSHLSLLCARTPSSPSYYVVSVRFVDGVICMKTGGQRRLAIFHIYCLV